MILGTQPAGWAVDKEMGHGFARKSADFLSVSGVRLFLSVLPVFIRVLFLCRAASPRLLWEEGLGDGEADFEEGHPPEDEIQNDDKHDQQEKGDDEDDLNRKRADKGKQAAAFGVERGRVVLHERFFLAGEHLNFFAHGVGHHEADAFFVFAHRAEADVGGQRNADGTRRRVGVEEGGELKRP